MQFMGHCAPWKATNGMENLLSQVLQFHKIGDYYIILNKYLHCFKFITINLILGTIKVGGGLQDNYCYF